MNLRTQWPIGLVCLLAVPLVTLGCGEKKLPSRDQIPIINRRVAELETRLRERSVAGIDSMLSVDILDKQLSSDSLLHFVYGPDNTFAFDRLGGCDVFFSRKFAVVNCHLVDSSGTEGRPIKLVWEPADDSLWLLSEFDLGESDSTADTTRTVGGE